MKRDHQEAAARKVAKLIEHEPDRRVRTWARFRLAGEPLAALARELKYADGSGVHQVARRLEAAAARDPALNRKMNVLKTAVKDGAELGG